MANLPHIHFGQLLKAVIGVFFTLPVGLAHAQDVTRLGGDLTSDLPRIVALELPSPNIRSEEAFQYHLEGHADFHSSMEGNPVLGPNFNHSSCGGCHLRNGRGAIAFSRGTVGSALLLKVSLKGLLPDGRPRDVPKVGEQLQDHTVSGKNRFNIRLSWEKVRGRYPDGTRYVLRKPKVTFKIPGVDSSRVVHSMRMTPPVVGMGLLEAIPASTLEALSDQFDLNRDGISGKINYVNSHETGTKQIGRFGFKASHPTVKQQSAAAFFHDMGMTSTLFRESFAVPEVSDDVLDRVTFYLQAAGIPPARAQVHPDIEAGKALFVRVGCEACHKMTLQTGPSSVVEVANQTIHPFTDLLLHDLGKDLGDARREFSATGREWRTTPLWGLGSYQVLSSRRPGFLHDGRAQTIEEAILWHAGEAKRSRQAFMKLKRFERAQLLKFLDSL